MSNKWPNDFRTGLRMSEETRISRREAGATAETIRQSSASAVDDLVAKIRSLISDEGLKVGDNLPTERELCERFQASRNTVMPVQ